MVCPIGRARVASRLAPSGLPDSADAGHPGGSRGFRRLVEATATLPRAFRSRPDSGSADENARHLAAAFSVQERGFSASIFPRIGARVSTGFLVLARL